MLIGIVIGLLVGWIFIPEPDLVKTLYAKLRKRLTTHVDAD